MKLPLLVALSLAPLACAGAEPVTIGPAQPAAAAAVVDLNAPPTPQPSAKPQAAPKPEPSAKPEAPAAQALKPADEQDGKELGMIGLLNTGAGGDPNAPTAPWGRDDVLGNDPLAQGGLIGSSAGDAQGFGGLGLSGVGGGGRGEGIGLGSIGTLGHGAGTGTGQGFGSGHGRLGGKRTKPPQIRMGATTVAGRLPPEVIQRIVRQSFGRFRLCYEDGLRNNPKLEGKVTVKFTIGRDGGVESVGNGGSTMPDAAVVSCVVRAFHGLSFPQPEGGKVSVTYPITFSPGEDAAPPPKYETPSTSSGTKAATTTPAPKP